MTLIGFGLGVTETVLRLLGHEIPVATVVLVALLLVSGSQFILFAMWFDMSRTETWVAGGAGARTHGSVLRRGQNGLLQASERFTRGQAPRG